MNASKMKTALFFICCSISSSYCLRQEGYQSRNLLSIYPQGAQFEAGEEPTVWDLLGGFLAPTMGDVSEQCRNDSQSYIDQLNKPTAFLAGEGWAFKMLDASAKLLPSGFLQGNLRLMGNFDSCLEVNAPTFKGQHCLISFVDPSQPENIPRGHDRIGMGSHPFENRLAASKQLVLQESEQWGSLAILLPMITLGRCVPDTCSADDVAKGVNEFLLTTLGADSNLTAYILSCESEDEVKPLDPADWVMIVIVLLFVLIVAVGTVIDVLFNKFRLDIFPEGVLKIVIGFSAYTNTVKIFSASGTRDDTLTCINGIRFLSMTWVLFGHAFAQSLKVSNNIISLLDENGPLLGNLSFEPFLNAFPSVDTFFFIGATLLSYITLKELDKTKGGGLKFWIMYYVHRYIRLTGVYAVILGLMATLYKFLSYGPYTSEVDIEHNECRTTLWTNLLYVNNLHWITGNPSRCVGEAWYLANEMQFFLVSPIFLLSMWRSTLLGIGVSLVALVAATIIPMVLIYQNDYPISLLGDTTGEYARNFYSVPWCRFQPYVLGLMFGWLLHKLRHQPKLKLSPFMSLWIWAGAGVVGALVVYGLHPYEAEAFKPDSHVSMALRVAYGGLHRVAWSLCLGWVILACVKQAAFPINSLLSWHAWIPLARLSYCIYLVHLKVLVFITSLPSFGVYSTHLLGVYWVLAILCMSIFVAYLMVIMFEAPIVHLEKVVFAWFGIGRLPAVRKSEESVKK